MIRPIQDFVFIERSPDITKEGLIHLAKSRQVAHGTVKYCGPGRTTKYGNVLPMSCKVGDKVYWNSWEGLEVDDEGNKLVCIHEDELHAIESA